MKRISAKRKLKLRSLRRELRQAKIDFWRKEEKFIYWLKRLHKLPINDKRWGRWRSQVEIYRLEMNLAKHEVVVADRCLKAENKRKKWHR